MRPLRQGAVLGCPKLPVLPERLFRDHQTEGLLMRPPDRRSRNAGPNTRPERVPDVGTGIYLSCKSLRGCASGAKTLRCSGLCIAQTRSARLVVVVLPVPVPVPCHACAI